MTATPSGAEFARVLAALKIDIEDHFTITVDAIDVMRNDNQVRIWILDRLVPDADMWGHGPSGTEGPLGECLGGIASCYTIADQEISA